MAAVAPGPHSPGAGCGSQEATRPGRNQEPASEGKVQHLLKSQTVTRKVCEAKVSWSLSYWN